MLDSVRRAFGFGAAGESSSKSPAPEASNSQASRAEKAKSRALKGESAISSATTIPAAKPASTTIAEANKEGLKNHYVHEFARDVSNAAFRLNSKKGQGLKIELEFFRGNLPELLAAKYKDKEAKPVELEKMATFVFEELCKAQKLELILDAHPSKTSKTEDILKGVVEGFKECLSEILKQPQMDPKTKAKFEELLANFEKLAQTRNPDAMYALRTAGSAETAAKEPVAEPPKRTMSPLAGVRPLPDPAVHRQKYLERPSAQAKPNVRPLPDPAMHRKQFIEKPATEASPPRTPPPQRPPPLPPVKT